VTIRPWFSGIFTETGLCSGLILSLIVYFPDFIPWTEAKYRQNVDTFQVISALKQMRSYEAFREKPAVNPEEMNNIHSSGKYWATAKISSDLSTAQIRLLRLHY